jgi:hypothetical protein
MQLALKKDFSKVSFALLKVAAALAKVLFNTVLLTLF